MVQVCLRRPVGFWHAAQGGRLPCPDEAASVKKKMRRAAQRRPGAITFHLLMRAHTQLGRGDALQYKHLRRVNLGVYIATKSPIKHARDQGEAATLAECLDHIFRGNLSKASDLLCARMLALEKVCKMKGDWKEASNLEIKTEDPGGLISTSGG